VLHIQPDRVVTKIIRPDGQGGYLGEDLPLMGRWNARRPRDGVLDVHVAGVMGAVSFRLLPAEADFTPPDDGDYPEPVPPPMPPPVSPPPPSPIDSGALTLAGLGKRCYEDFKPVGAPMLRYYACQKGLGQFNALKRAIKAKNTVDAKGIVSNRSRDQDRRCGFLRLRESTWALQGYQKH